MSLSPCIRTGKARIWVGFHDAGLVAFLPGGGFRAYTTTRDGLPSNEIFGIRESRNGDLLIGTRYGLSRMHAGHFTNFHGGGPSGARGGVRHQSKMRTGDCWRRRPSLAA